MKTLDHNAIARSVATMGYQLTEQILAKRHAYDRYKLAETQQHYQLEVSGTAGSGAYADWRIQFQEVIYFAPLQRDLKTEDPQVTHGVQLDSGDAFFSVFVKEWLLDDSANYVGAIVRVGVMQAGWAPASQYAGTIHITFHGLSIPVEDPGYADTP